MEIQHLDFTTVYLRVRPAKRFSKERFKVSLCLKYSDLDDLNFPNGGENTILLGWVNNIKRHGLQLLLSDLN